MNKKRYVAPKTEIVKIDLEDVVTNDSQKQAGLSTKLRDFDGDPIKFRFQRPSNRNSID